MKTLSVRFFGACDRLVTTKARFISDYFKYRKPFIPFRKQSSLSKKAPHCARRYIMGSVTKGVFTKAPVSIRTLVARGVINP